MADGLENSLTHQEEALLEPFVTSLDSPIFGLRNLPEVVKGALFSRYSRSDKDLRRILLDEFIKAPEADFSRIVGGSTQDGEQIVAIQQAEAFYDRVLVGYGDDSVAELGGAHLACEGISNIAAKALEDSRLGISPLEKSTRYVPFNRKVNGRYRYHREASIMASSHASLYEATLDHLFETYTTLVEPLLAWVQSCTPKDANTSDRAYYNATRAKALDLLRGLLPMATLTNVGLFGNGRAFEYLLVKLAASPHAEVHALGASMQEALDQMIPSFVKRSKSERGLQYARYLSTNRDRTQHLTQKRLATSALPPPSHVQLVEYDPDAEAKVIAAILYPHSDLAFEQLLIEATELSVAEREEIIQTYVGDRASRFHRPGRAFEETYYTFDVLADLGAYRDLHRHRVLTQERQRYTVRHGHMIPPELEEAGLAEPYRNALEKAAETTEWIAQDLPIASQYVVPFAYRVRWRMKLNLREVYHFVELRSARQGHPTYRAIAQEMYRLIQHVHPTLVASMHFVDMESYALERLAAEQKIDLKLEQRQG
ncbi:MULTISPECIES: FAD-dependent thymidylate synthase [unclassified Leptolyngbya]|uniref:FAD-dependent thymidylate synthase n=1 Tax=unclassified Leptolyngbya TaxID=2650499 RepID=UPI0016891C13|nr:MULTISPECIES: FAD-dependent thymidylate synthase [unclassified Leptolyngbya]MBD1911496.1 FAD-dependent thymidylate synthase [Leptolyngbya sp. FACHB-8]MBD2155263.1 FAD-dependent thymidylate synthase [Leptolyngbya sp. FACHB-16]